MRSRASAALARGRDYRSLVRNSRAYKVARFAVLSLACVYVVLLSFPHPLFAHVTNHNYFTVYSRDPLDEHVYAVLDRAHLKLTASPLYVLDVRPNVFLTGSTRFYT